MAAARGSGGAGGKKKEDGAVAAAAAAASSSSSSFSSPASEAVKAKHLAAQKRLLELVQSSDCSALVKKARQVVESARWGIVFRTVALGDGQNLPVGRSRVGGRADMTGAVADSAAAAYFSGQDRDKMVFVCQLNTRDDFKGAMCARELPQGMLYAFADDYTASLVYCDAETKDMRREALDGNQEPAVMLAERAIEWRDHLALPPHDDEASAVAKAGDYPTAEEQKIASAYIKLKRAYEKGDWDDGYRHRLGCFPPESVQGTCAVRAVGARLLKQLGLEGGAGGNHRFRTVLTLEESLSTVAWKGDRAANDFRLCGSADVEIGEQVPPKGKRLHVVMRRADFRKGEFYDESMVSFKE